MPEQVDFIGRKSEIDRISKLIATWGERQVVCIHGVGGIGKTRLLQEIYTRHTEASKICMTEILDFDEQRLLNPENISQKVAEILGPKTFEPFLRAQLDYHRMQLAGVSPERLKQEIVAVNRTFAKCFNAVANERKVMLLLDTTDHLEKGKGVWQDLEIKIPQLKNVTILMAGRNARQIGESFQKTIDGYVEIIELQPLSEQDSQRYLQQRQRQRHITIEPELAEKLLLLSGGRPILIDLSVEWRVHGISFDWLIKSSLEEIRALSDKNLKTRQQEFEQQLVLHIAQTREDRDDLILLMSRIYPLDVKMLSVLLDMPEDKAEKLFEEATKYVFVKLLPDGRITLHDEMRRLVSHYLWEEVDPEGDRRQQESKHAAQFLEEEIHALDEQIARLKEKEKAAGEKKESERMLDAFTEREALVRDMWILKEQYLRHIAYVDLEKGVKTFADFFDEATHEYRFSYRESLIEQMQQYSGRLSTEQCYKLDRRWVQHLIDMGKYEEAKDVALHILDYAELEPEQRVDWLNQTGNIEIRLGHYSNGINHFTDAVKICNDNSFEEKDSLQEFAMRARHALGWGYRSVGNYDQAIKEYKIAHHLSILLNDKLEEAKILNDLAFAHHRQGNHEGASKLADSAQSLWEELGNKRGIGTVFHIRARICFGRDPRKYIDEAVSYDEKAFEIFKSQGDIDWMHRMYIERGRMYWKRANINFFYGNLETVEDDLKKAEADMLKAHSTTEGQHRISALHYLGEIYRTRDRIYPGQYIDKSEEYFKQSYKECKKAAMNFMQLNSLHAWAFIVVDREEYYQLDYFENEYQEYVEKWSNVVEPESTDGLLLKSLGDMALGVVPPKIDKVLQYYCKGLPFIGIYEFDPTFGLDVQLPDIDRRLQSSENFKELRIELGKNLAESWEKNPRLEISHPEALLYFTRWQQGRVYNDQD